VSYFNDIWLLFFFRNKDISLTKLAGMSPRGNQKETGKHGYLNGTCLPSFHSLRE
jgi:hypothetical protein